MMAAPIWITAVGAVTSVGHNAATSCASIRAGLARPDRIEGYEVLDLSEQEPVGVLGHPIGFATFGFAGVGRWLQMAVPALEDLSASYGLPSPDDLAFWSATICYVVMPVLDADRFDPVGLCGSDERLEKSFVQPLMMRCGAYFRPARTILLTQGRMGTLHAIEQAGTAFGKDGVERIVIVAVDSLVDESSLSWLAEQGRLKEDSNPCGLTPGEGAMAVLLEQPDAAAHRGAECLAELTSVSTDREPQSFISGEHSQGEALSRVVHESLARAGIPPPYRAEVVTDLNGESWRAEEYGYCRVRVPSSSWDGDSLGLPATSVGDIGAAMTALELILACVSVERKYSLGNNVLLISSDEYGEVGAAVVTRKA